MSLFFDSDADPQIVVKLPKPTRPHVRQPASLPNIQSVRGFHRPCFLLGPNRHLFSLKASPSDHTPAALFRPLRRRLSWTRAPLILATRRLRYRTRSQTWSPAPPPLRRVRTLAGSARGTGPSSRRPSPPRQRYAPRRALGLCRPTKRSRMYFTKRRILCRVLSWSDQLFR